jgi:hypothetical protein
MCLRLVACRRPIATQYVPHLAVVRRGVSQRACARAYGWQTAGKIERILGIFFTFSCVPGHCQRSSI